MEFAIYDYWNWAQSLSEANTSVIILENPALLPEGSLLPNSSMPPSSLLFVKLSHWLRRQKDISCEWYHHSVSHRPAYVMTTWWTSTQVMHCNLLLSWKQAGCTYLYLQRFMRLFPSKCCQFRLFTKKKKSPLTMCSRSKSIPQDS